MIQSYNKKKNKSKELEQLIVKEFKREVESQHIKNIAIGFETANQLILDKIESGSKIDEIKSFCKKALENSSVSEQSAQDVINELSNLFNFSCEKICNNK